MLGPHHLFPRLGRASKDSSWAMPRRLALLPPGSSSLLSTADTRDNEVLCPSADVSSESRQGGVDTWAGGGE